MDIKVEFDVDKLIGGLDELQKIRLPRAASIALNQTAYKISREVLKQEADDSFDNPVPLTLNAFLYKKASEQKLETTIFIRDDVPKGNSPSRYLRPHIVGQGYDRRTYLTRFQRALENTATTQIDGRTVQAKNRGTYMQPVLGQFKLNKYGNIPQGQYNKVLTSLMGGVSSADYFSVRRPATQSAFVAKGRFSGNAFVRLDEQTLQHPYFANRFSQYRAKPGIYRVVPGTPTRFYRAFTERSRLTYQPRFDFFYASVTAANKYFPEFLSKQKFF